MLNTTTTCTATTCTTMYLTPHCLFVCLLVTHLVVGVLVAEFTDYSVNKLTWLEAFGVGNVIVVAIDLCIALFYCLFIRDADPLAVCCERCCCTNTKQ